MAACSASIFRRKPEYWAAGGDDFSLYVNSFLNVFAFYKKDRYSWDNTLDLYLGYLKTTSLGAINMVTSFQLY